MEEYDIDYESFSELDLGENGDLTPDEQSGLLTLPVFAVFADLKEMGQFEDFAPKYQITFRLPKDNEHAQKLFAVSSLVGSKTWKDDLSKVDDAFFCIAQGVKPNKSNISIQDGDLHKPTYNAGNWLVKASRREDEGMPALLDVEGNAIYEDGELVGDEYQVVKPGDFCMALIRVWAQKKRDRINFSLVGVRLVKRGAGQKAVASAQEEAALGGLGSAGLPALPDGFGGSADAEVVTEKPKPRRKAVAKKAGKKSASKKKAAKRKGVFRKK